jgi:site-specific recombinase XerD
MSTALVTSQGDYPLETAIVLWIHEKGKRSKSYKTRRAYADTLAHFRVLLRQAGVDLDGPTREVATIAQGWAALPKPDGSPVAATTHNQRLAILSSFFSFVRKRKLLLLENPVEGIERMPVQSYASASPLDPGTVQKRMRAIDRTTIAGTRDHVLLAIALQTGHTY